MAGLATALIACAISVFTSGPIACERKRGFAAARGASPSGIINVNSAMAASHLFVIVSIPSRRIPGCACGFFGFF
jgi:hypothetical protein